jgi:hypothetical protein
MFDDLGKYLLIAMLAALAYAAWHAWGIRQASPNWPSVEGEMLVARARAHNETGEQSGTPTHQWFTEVRYRYTVDGVTYEGTRLKAFDAIHFDEQQARAALAPFPPGARVKVYYDPRHPASSVLIPG